MRNIYFWLALAFLGMCTFSSLGYTYRQFECRKDMIVVMIKAPDSDRLIPVAISTCSLPEQWGGMKAPIPAPAFGGLAVR